jgi:hypothetical protein
VVCVKWRKSINDFNGNENVMVGRNPNDNANESPDTHEPYSPTNRLPTNILPAPTLIENHKLTTDVNSQLPS